MPGGGILSDCLQHAGADMVSKLSLGALQRTDISKAGLAGEAASGPNDLQILRAELEEKTRTLKTLQRHYESMSALLANEREELAGYRRAHGDHERECHDLRKENDQLSKDLTATRNGQAGADDERSRQQKQAGVAEKKVLELQEVLKDSRAQVHGLQESLKASKKAEAAAETRARGMLAEAEAKTLDAQRQNQRGASELQNEVAKLQKALEMERASLASARDELARETKCRDGAAAATVAAAKAKEDILKETRAQMHQLQESLRAAKQAEDAAEARARGMLAEAEANTLEARRHGHHEASELQKELAELKTALDAERALVRSVQDELTLDGQSRDASRDATAAAAAMAKLREKEAEEHLQKLQLQLRAQKEENERNKRRELERLQEHLTANQRESVEQLQAEREQAVKALEDRLQAHEALFSQQREELTGKVGGLASERRRLASEVKNLEEKERKASGRVGELLAREVDLETAVTAERSRAVALETSLAEAEAARLECERQLSTERAHWKEQLRSQSHRTEDLESAAEAQLNDALAAKNEAEGALVAARREQAMLGEALLETQQALKLIQDKLQDSEQEHDSLRADMAALRESSAAIAAERDMLQGAVADANQRLSAAETDCDGLRAAKDADASAAQSALRDASASAQATSAEASKALRQASASAQAALAAEQEAVRKAEMLRLKAEEIASGRATAVDELSRRVAEQESRLAAVAKLTKDLEEARSDLATARQESVAAREEAKHWGERAARIETEQGTSCARLKRSEANLELMRSELEEARSDNQQLTMDLDLQEQRHAARGG